MLGAAVSNVMHAHLQANIVQKEGVGALFKGALPRAIWTAPLGAMNFAGDFLRSFPRLVLFTGANSKPTKLEEAKRGVEFGLF
jgi:hypothetical protein